MERYSDGHAGKHLDAVKDDVVGCGCHKSVASSSCRKRSAETGATDSTCTSNLLKKLRVAYERAVEGLVLSSPSSSHDDLSTVASQHPSEEGETILQQQPFIGPFEYSTEEWMDELVHLSEDPAMQNGADDLLACDGRHNALYLPPRESTCMSCQNVSLDCDAGPHHVMTIATSDYDVAVAPPLPHSSNLAFWYKSAPQHLQIKEFLLDDEPRPFRTHPTSSAFTTTSETIFHRYAAQDPRQPHASRDIMYTNTK